MNVQAAAVVAMDNKHRLYVYKKQFSIDKHRLRVYRLRGGFQLKTIDVSFNEQRLEFQFSIFSIQFILHSNAGANKQQILLYQSSPPNITR